MSMRTMSSNSDNIRIIFRADAGSHIGFGHYVRTIALGAYLAPYFDCHIVTRNPDSDTPGAYQLQLAEDAGLKIIEIGGRTREKFDPVFINKINATDIVVLDNYYYETEFQKKVREKCKALVCIDDMHDRHFVADILMTFCPLKREDFSLEPYTKFFGGIEWSFLRQPFLRPQSKRRPDHKEPRQIVIAMGGADPLHLTDKIISILQRINPELKISVIAGSTVQVTHNTGNGVTVFHNANAKEIAELFDTSDMGIFPASTVCVEAISRNLPIAAGYYVDNQEEFYKYGVKQGWFKPLGCLLDDENTIEKRIREALSAKSTVDIYFDFNSQKEKIIRIFRNLAAES